MDREAWLGYSPRGGKESDTTERLHFHFSFSCIGEGMATHSSVLARRIPGKEEPGGLRSMGSQSQTRLKRLSSSSSKVLLQIGRYHRDMTTKCSIGLWMGSSERKRIFWGKNG